MSDREVKSKGSVWVLTEEYNDHDQHGAYFLAVFKDKPTIETLMKYFLSGKGNSYYNDPMQALAFLLHVQNGGGRMKSEDSWYNLEKVELK